MAGWSVQLTVGGYQFWIENASLDKFSRSSTYRWVAQERIARPVAMQNVGTGEDTITLNGYFHPHLKGKAHALDKLRQMADEGIPYNVVTGTGINLGRWCIVEIKDDFSEMLDDLRPRRVDFTVTLKKYFEDGLK